MSSGRLVPWMATRPLPPAYSLSAFENAVSGSTVSWTFSLASINGEAEPRIFQAGQRVPAGAIHLGRSDIELVTLQAWSESLLAQLLAPGERTSRRHMWLERIVRGYLIGIIGLAAVSGLFWWLTTGDLLRTGAVVTAVLVVSLGRLGDMYGRVRMYNLGFAVFTVGSGWQSTARAKALWL